MKDKAELYLEPFSVVRCLDKHFKNPNTSIDNNRDSSIIDSLQESSTHDKMYCNECLGAFKLISLNPWYKGTDLEDKEFNE